MLAKSSYLAWLFDVLRQSESPDCKRRSRTRFETTSASIMRRRNSSERIFVEVDRQCCTEQAPYQAITYMYDFIAGINAC